MVGLAGIACIIHINASSICFNTFCINICGDRTSGKNFSHNSIITMDFTEFGHLDGRVISHSRATNIFIMVTVHTVINIRTFHIFSLILYTYLLAAPEFPPLQDPAWPQLIKACTEGMTSLLVPLDWIFRRSPIEEKAA